MPRNEKWEMRKEKREKRGLWKIPRRMQKKVKEIEEGKRTGIIRKMAILLPFVIAFCMLALRLFRVALIPCFVDRSLPDGRSTTHVRLLWCFFLENWMMISRKCSVLFGEERSWNVGWVRFEAMTSTFTKLTLTRVSLYYLHVINSRVQSS